RRVAHWLPRRGELPLAADEARQRLREAQADGVSARVRRRSAGSLGRPHAVPGREPRGWRRHPKGTGLAHPSCSPRMQLVIIALRRGQGLARGARWLDAVRADGGIGERHSPGVPAGVRSCAMDGRFEDADAPLAGGMDRADAGHAIYTPGFLTIYDPL